MKILQLCKKFPFPLKDGESIAVTYLSKALHQLGCEITLLAMNTSKHYFNISELPKDFDHYKAIHIIELDNRIKASEAFFNLFSSESYHVVRYISGDYQEKLVSLLEEEKFDIVQMETIYLAPYIDIIKANSNATIVQRSHNVEFEIWERVARNTVNPIKKWYLELLAKRLRAFEVLQLNRYDLLLAITERDKQRFVELGCKIPMLTIPIGLQASVYQPGSYGTPVKGSIGFIGSMDWTPNIEGIKWFLDNVWGEIALKDPNMKLYLAGRNTPDWLYEKKYPNVIIEGEIDDALEFISTKEIMIVPLLSGGGMKVKILESLILGVLTLTTSLGLEGIPAKEGKEILVADSPVQFSEKIEWASKNPEAVEEIRNAGRKFAINHFDNQEIAKKVLDFYHKENVAF